MKLKNIFISIFFLILTNFAFSEEILKEINYEKVTVNSLDDIEKWRTYEGLYAFTTVNIDLRKLSPSQKKNTFIDILLPSINVVNAEIQNDSDIIKKLSKKADLNDAEKIYAQNIFKKYRVEYGNWKELSSRLIIYPTSLILTQGAIESGWGTSRFFRQANNIFGMWSTDPNEPRLPAKGIRDNGFVPHLKKYFSIKDSVDDFVLNLSRNSAYKNLRKLVNENQLPQIIATGLINYSEEREKYVKKVITTMNYNDLTEYDKKI
ncbi:MULTISPECIES: glucosaminidase domain-containing protein [unclassified Fusobacterium]|uniref:glucosaminidase domain-containing protein n=1 Tax=Fusobacterium sp. TaxID=68766 RepID=UPI0025BAA74C|nr:glucosaminidase domain-containing protein [Fusobacterium sp.]